MRLVKGPTDYHGVSFKRQKGIATAMRGILSDLLRDCLRSCRYRRRRRGARSVERLHRPAALYSSSHTFSLAAKSWNAAPHFQHFLAYINSTSPHSLPCLSRYRYADHALLQCTHAGHGIERYALSTLNPISSMNDSILVRCLSTILPTVYCMTTTIDMTSVHPVLMRTSPSNS